MNEGVYPKSVKLIFAGLALASAAVFVWISLSPVDAAVEKRGYALGALETVKAGIDQKFRFPITQENVGPGRDLEILLSLPAGKEKSKIFPYRLDFQLRVECGGVSPLKSVNLTALDLVSVESAPGDSLQYFSCGTFQPAGKQAHAIVLNIHHADEALADDPPSVIVRKTEKRIEEMFANRDSARNFFLGGAALFTLTGLYFLASALRMKPHTKTMENPAT